MTEPTNSSGLRHTSSPVIEKGCGWGLAIGVTAIAAIIYMTNPSKEDRDKAAASASEKQKVVAASKPTELELQRMEVQNKDKIDRLKADVKTLAERDYEGRLIFWKQIVLLAPKNKPYAEEARKAAAQVAQHTYENPADGASVEAIRPRKEGFGNVLVVDLTIRNDSLSNLKDFIISCETKGNSGTTIDVNRRPIYDVVDARTSRTFREINMGFINNQAASTDCRVEGASIA
ncbi:MAG: hypothetical protein KKA44_14175 [Alphaproteobacteria bacterium]|nr:hypothetical protein [Alphaproteobacteria bacterium]MBU0864729.1 hypothetical protein [Alphaproteobacteria bacterium]MBU1826102.1 hypothetical protein [Alphaproteobacteria bacterium]